MRVICLYRAKWTPDRGLSFSASSFFTRKLLARFLMRRVASMVDRRLKEMEITTGLPAQQAMALTCFNLADELIKSRDEITAMKRRMQAELVRAADEEEPEAQNAPPERPRRRAQAGN